MKRIKDIITALKTLSRVPSVSIRAAWERVYKNQDVTGDDIALIGGIVAAVCGIAEDMEKPAKAEGEAK